MRELPLDIPPMPEWESFKARGWAATPGTGPVGKTCKDCAFVLKKEGYSKNYYKCGLNEHQTNGQATDILLKTPACKHFRLMESRQALEHLIAGLIHRGFRSRSDIEKALNEPDENLFAAAFAANYANEMTRLCTG